MFGFSQVVEMMDQRDTPKTFDTKKLTLRESLLTKDEVKRILPPATRSGFLGTVIGSSPRRGSDDGSLSELSDGKDGSVKRGISSVRAV